MSVEWLSAMQYAVGQLGGEFDGFDTGVKKMQNTIADAERGVQPAVDAIERLGLSVQQVAALSPEQQFMTIGDALSRIKDPAARAAAAVDIFGRAGTNMLPVFSEGAAGVEKFMQRARELGVVMSSQMAKDAGDLHHQMEEVWAVVKSAGNAVAEALVPTLKELGDWISRNVQAFRAWAAEHQEAIQWAFKLAAAAVAVGGALVLVSVPLRAIAGIMAGLRAIIIATTVAIQGFRIALAAASAHPIVAVLIVLATIIGTIAAKALLARDAINEMNGAGQIKPRLEPVSANAQEDLANLQRLSDAGGGKLDAAGMKDAKEWLGALASSGYDLGVTVDECTGSVNGLTGAWEKFANEAKKRTLADLDKQIADLEAKAKETVFTGGPEGFGLGMEVPAPGASNAAKWAAITKELRSRTEKMSPLELVGAPAAVVPGGSNAATREIEREIARDKLATMKDAEAKELALLDLEHADRVTKAKEVGADLAKLEELFQVKRTNIVSKYADERRKAEREEAKKRFEVDAQYAEERDRQQQSEEEARASSILDLKKLYIEATKEGKDKELALLEVERDAALKQAFEEGVPQEYVNAAFEIRKAMVEAADVGEKQKSAMVGMFSPARLEALGVIDAPQQRTAKATEKISETTKKMLDELILQRQWNVFE
jgi:hypothetical protein